MELTDTQRELIETAQKRVKRTEQAFEAALERRQEIIRLTLDAHDAGPDSVIRKTEDGRYVITEEDTPLEAVE